MGPRQSSSYGPGTAFGVPLDLGVALDFGATADPSGSSVHADPGAGTPSTDGAAVATGARRSVQAPRDGNTPLRGARGGVVAEGSARAGADATSAAELGVAEISGGAGSDAAVVATVMLSPDASEPNSSARCPNAKSAPLPKSTKIIATASHARLADRGAIGRVSAGPHVDDVSAIG